MIPSLNEFITTAFDLVLVLLGFSLIVVIHELGHFLAARWAKIRVLAFAVGFGPAIVSYRKGLGWRRGSSESEYRRWLHLNAAGATPDEGERASADTVSPTEYRLNALPLGGYVKMLGQEDLNPGATSAAKDSYQSASVLKRMVVISAGVVFNIITAAAMFVAVFMAGLPVQPAVLGTVAPGSPADTAGLLPGDEILEVDGHRAQRFDDIALGTAMAKPGERVSLLVSRPGEAAPFEVSVEPRPGRLTGLLEMGVGPAQTLRFPDAANDESRTAFVDQLETLGLGGAEPGTRVVSAQIAGHPPVELTTYADLLEVYRDSEGAGVALTIQADDGRSTLIDTTPRAELQIGLVETSNGWIEVRHLLGLTPVLMVRPGTDPAQGLESGDVFAQLGTAEYPSIARGVTEIRGRTGQPIDIVVERTTGTGTDRVEIDAEVTRMGTVGFVIDDTADRSTMLSLSPRLHTSVLDERATPQPAGTLSIRPGARVVAVNGERVETFFDIRGAIERSLSGAPTDTGNETRVPITLIPSPAIDGVEPPLYETELVLSADHVSAIRALSWLPPVPPGLFVYEERDLRAGGPVEAVSMGLVETRRVMITAYVTFARLFQGTIKVEHLKGPVGIAHIGTIVAGKGPVWLLFFLALISVNLAVINFLPIPIVDGGQFLMLCYEGVARKPVPIVVQNGLTLAGLALIGVVFIVVTVNDVRQLLGL